MPLLQLVYASRPFGYDELTLGSILNTARMNNARDGITGALICREDLFLQMLEGPKPHVEALFERIGRDDRHAEMVRLWSAEDGMRMFPDWAMKHDPARSWMWTAAEVSAGVISKVTPEEVHGVFVRLAHEPEPACTASQ